MKCQAILSLSMLFFAAGCFTQTRTYSLSVRNDLNRPVTLCVTKMYGPPEQGWESPEELIQPPHPASDQTPPGAVLPPGKTVNRDDFKGDFDPSRGRAILRVYAGTPTLTQMNAMSRGSSDRLDVPLNKGLNRIEIIPGLDGGMMSKRVDNW